MAKNKTSAITGVLGIFALTNCITSLNLNDFSFVNNLKVYISLIVGLILIAISIYSQLKAKKNK